MNRPIVTVHFAQSLDGRLARSAARVLLSSVAGTKSAHEARENHDAVLVGIGTVRIDDPQLTVRLPSQDSTEASGVTLLRVVLSSTLFVPEHAQLAKGPDVLVIGAEDRIDQAERSKRVAAGVQVYAAKQTEDGRVDLHVALAELSRRGVKKLLVEGGATILTAFLRERLVDHVEIEFAPLFLGGEALASIGELGEVGARLTRVKYVPMDENILVRGDLVWD